MEAIDVLNGLRREYEARKHDVYATGETNIALMCLETANALERTMDELGREIDRANAAEKEIARLRESAKISGETSDGYHTFNELYHHRAVLFSVICNDRPTMAWKSKKHHDGTMYDGMFIVGINTENGQATYHYDIDPYWEIFYVRELDKAPEWDGHTAEQAIARIGQLQEVD